MIYLENLPLKSDEVNDTDIMIIEDSEDTKRITIKDLKKAIIISSDKKLESVINEITNSFTVSDEKLKNKIDSIGNAYYSLARNYEYLNSSFEEMKEKFTEYITKTAQVMIGVPTIINCETKNGEVTINWNVTLNAEGFKIYKISMNEDGEFANELTFVSTIQSPTTLSYTDTGLDVGSKHKYYVAAYINTTSGEQLGALSAEKEITVQ